MHRVEKLVNIWEYYEQVWHNFFDGPPDNGTADKLNSKDVRAYMQVCQQVRAWKNDKGNHKQP